SGFLGTRLREHLTEHGHSVVRLVRGSAAGPDQVRWAPYDGPLAASALDDVDVVVNLAGAPTVGNPHSARWRHELERSRVVTTRVLAEAISASDTTPVFLAGNGISFYGDRGAVLLDESAPTYGDNLLTRVTRAWQQAASPAIDAGARVVVLRTSPVLDRRSAPLSLLLPLFKLGLGGPLGSGKQYFPTLSTADWVAAVRHCAEHDTVSGPVNLTLPTPATNHDFTKALGAALHRPTFLKAPAFAIRAGAGAMAPELLGSVRAVPKKLLDDGFTFAHPDITSAVAAGLAAGR
ncbi:MAG: NAD-dependent epimerase/dehydratase, partial [Nocardioidaceae bacterium]|nr:NAD-dependent epimerase/dehydratase [Nocardioidaceae bacterium]